MQNKEIIAVIRLSPGEAGYYDPLSKIHLTIGKPQREVFAGTNSTQLRRSVASRRLRLISGSLGENAPISIQLPTNETQEQRSPVNLQCAPGPVNALDASGAAEFSNEVVPKNRDSADEALEQAKDEKATPEKTVAGKSVAEKKSGRRKAQ